MADKKTVTLPAIPADQVYRAIPKALTFHVDGAGKVKSDYAFEFDGDNALSPVLLAASIRQGLVRLVGTATTSAKEDETPKAACDRRFAEIVAGTYKPGQGGGARVDTLTVVLRESIVTAAVNNLAMKKGDAVKAAREDSKALFQRACDKAAESIDNATGAEVFAIQWPKAEAYAKAEAERRDKATGFDFDLGDFA